MTYQVGATRSPYVDIAPYDASTVVVLTLVRPDGTVVTPALSGPVAQPSGAGRWSATGPYTLTLPGDWYERWVATNATTGLGAGSSSTLLAVDPLPPASGSSITPWATPADYASIIGGALPTDLAMKLRVATLTLRGETGLALYLPTDPTGLAALKEACCWQAKYAVDNGWTTGAPVGQRTVKLGSAELGEVKSQAGGGGPIPRINPVAWEILDANGFTGSYVGTDTAWLGW